MNMNLFKYSTINCYSITNLTKNQLYMQPAIHLNDPYEFIFNFDVKEDEYLDFIKLIYGDQYTIFLDKKCSLDEVLTYARDYYFPEARKEIGVACLTKNQHDDLMWAHYGNNHRGICIEYDITKFPFDQFKPIDYVSETLTISMKDISMLSDQKIGKFEEMFLRKHKIWTNETEWRLISKANSTINYEANSIVSITFGFFCSDKDKEDIYKSTTHLDIKYYDVVRSKNMYSINKRLIEK
jgi:hypothetical protein